MKISKNFTLEELTRSNTALRMSIDNTPSKEHILKLRLLATEFLQPLRDRIGALRVTVVTGRQNYVKLLVATNSVNTLKQKQ